MPKSDQKDSQKDRKYESILGIDVLSTSTPDLLNSLEEKIENKEKFSIFTPNPEIVLASINNKLLQKALNTADFSVPDGVGLKYAAKFLHGRSLTIIPGRKLFTELVKLANKKGWKIFLFGGWGNTAELATEKLIIENSMKNEKYKLKIEFASGPRLDNSANPVSQLDRKEEIDAVDKINQFKPDILFVAFGAPKQEIWIMNNIKTLNAKCFMAIGGTLRYEAGVVPLPPIWMENLGLEWLFRLVTEPKRLGRILNASVNFPMRILLSRFENNKKSGN